MVPAGGVVPAGGIAAAGGVVPVEGVAAAGGMVPAGGVVPAGGIAAAGGVVPVEGVALHKDLTLIVAKNSQRSEGMSLQYIGGSDPQQLRKGQQEAFEQVA